MHYRVVITGASSGVGAAAALAFAAAPAFTAAGNTLDLFLTGRDEAALRSVAAEASAKGASSVAVGVGDVSSFADVTRLHGEFLAALPAPAGAAPFDVLVANAGCNRTGLMETLSEADYDAIMDTNVKGVWAWTSAMLPAMKAAGRGQVIVTSSVLGLRCVPRAALYCASKFALQGMVGALRAELAGSGVKIATVNPGAIATAWWREPHRGGKRDAVPDIPMLAPEDVATAILTIAGQSAASDIDKIVLDPAGSK